jgi:hypothetical protein
MKPLSLQEMSFEELLNLRFCDLPVTMETPEIRESIALLKAELIQKAVYSELIFYIGDEWFSPDQVPAIAFPFYLAHPKLKALQFEMMHEAEGAEPKEQMKILRHEAGHALAHAYQLPRRRSWQKIFGDPRAGFSDFYRAKPYSRRFVRNLEDNYAQSHPEEDFAETFAVWLDPESCWPKQYATWPALAKLEYVDSLMRQLRNQSPRIKTGYLAYDINSSRKKLSSHYEEKKKHSMEQDPSYFDRELQAIFVRQRETENPEITASAFLKRHQNNLIDTIRRWSHERKYTVENLLAKILIRCRDLNLRFSTARQHAVLLELSAFLTALATQYRITGRLNHRI